MPKHNSSIFLLFILLAVQSIAEEKEKQKLESSNTQDNEEADSNDIRSSAITIIEAPDLSNPPLSDLKEDDEDGISNILSEKTLSAIDMLTSIPGETWVQKFLSQVDSDNDFGDELDDTELELEDIEEPVVELTAEQIEGK